MKHDSRTLVTRGPPLAGISELTDSGIAAHTGGYLVPAGPLR
jgi:hypothetical protein